MKNLLAILLIALLGSCTEQSSWINKSTLEDLEPIETDVPTIKLPSFDKPPQQLEFKVFEGAKVMMKKYGEELEKATKSHWDTDLHTLAYFKKRFENYPAIQVTTSPWYGEELDTQYGECIRANETECFIPFGKLNKAGQLFIKVEVFFNGSKKKWIDHVEERINFIHQTQKAEEELKAEKDKLMRHQIKLKLIEKM